MIKKDGTQEQFELFSKTKIDLANKRIFNKEIKNFNIVLSLDNIIIVFISIILAIIFSFSLGVNKGKKINMDNIVKRIEEETQQSMGIPTVKQAVKKEEKSIDKEEVAVNKYTIQIATYQKNSYAEKEAQKLKKEGYEAIVVPRGKFIEVCVGSFNDKNQAKISLKKLKEIYRDCFVRRL